MCIYYWVQWEKEKNLKTELIEAFEVIMAKTNSRKHSKNPIGLVLAKYYHSEQVKEEKQKSRFLEGWSQSYKEISLSNTEPQVSNYMKIIFKNNLIQTLFGEEKGLRI